MRRLIALGVIAYVMIFMSMAFTVSAQRETVYVASKIYRAGARYHRPDCCRVKRIKYKDYFTSPKEAIKKGYTPCKICLPPER